MNKVLAVFRKEYLETRTTTLIFWLVGVLCPLLKYLRANYDEIGVFSTLIEADPFTLGGILAVWLNATFLCASTFAREREDGTFQTLRRLSPDWRVASLGKIGYVLASTLVLAAFFAVESIVAAKIGGGRSFQAFRDAINANNADLTLTLASFVAFSAWVWGLFWTARTSRQTSAIFLSVFCSFLVGILALTIAWAITPDQAVQRQILAAILAATGLLVLAAAPGKSKFGYLDAEKGSDAESKENGSGATWNDVDVAKKGRSFPALLSLVFTDAAIMFRSPASVLFELALLFALSACMFGARQIGLNVITDSYYDLYTIATTFLAIYCFFFASGLFYDSKRKNSVVKERLSVNSGAYWLANALAGFLVCMAAFAGSVLLNLCVVTQITLPEDYFVDMAEYFFVLWCASLWCAALDGSRLVVGVVAFVVFLAIGISSDEIFYGVDTSFVERFFLTMGVRVALGLIFVVASYRIVANRARYRKAPWSVAIPAILTVACVAIVAWPGDKFHPREYNYRMVDLAAIPKTQTEYDQNVADARKSVESVDSAPLFKTSDGTDAVAVELNDLREQLVDACELTKRRAATFAQAENAENAFYVALRKALNDPTRPAPEPTEPDALIKFLAEIPSIRPTAEQQADNNYTFAQFGNLDDGCKSESARKTIAEARAVNDKVWKSASWNSFQVTAIRLEFLDKKIQGEESPLFADKPTSYALTPGGKRYDKLGEALDPTNQTARNEIARRVLLLKLAAQTPRPDGSDRPWESFSAIYLRKLVPEIPQTPMSPNIAPLIAQGRRNPELFKPCPDPDKLVPFVDEQGRPLTTPDLRLRRQTGSAGDDVPKETVDFSNQPAYYDPDAPLRLTASAPKYATDLSDDEIGSLEIPGVYPVYKVDGTPLAFLLCDRWHGVTHNAVDKDGKPIIFVPEPCGKKPDFDCGDAKLMTSRGESPSNEPLISRVRALLPFRPDGENSYVVPDLWAIRTIEESDGKTVERVKYLDSTGKEPLDQNGVPKYAEKRALFNDFRYVDEPKEGESGIGGQKYDYVFVYPQNYRPTSGGTRDDSPWQLLGTPKVYRIAANGEFVELSRQDGINASESDWTLYANFPAVAFLTTSRWVLDPAVQQKPSYRSPVVIVEPLLPVFECLHFRSPMMRISLLPATLPLPPLLAS